MEDGCKTCLERTQASVRFKEGLSTLDVLQEGTAHPQDFKGLFLQDTTSLRASDIVQLFQPVDMSLPGSNKRRLEARTTAFWRDWLLEVKAGFALPVTLEAVLIFATGLRRIPAMGFGQQPQLGIRHPEDGLARFSRANTCSLVLRLPVAPSYTKFRGHGARYEQCRAVWGGMI
ncbi:hypothetical protein GJAV_G00256190 [Gymnothorax javanicus]|nr:hypothetical protein GJAV_G00256190 [Gymnothorax javanicus]